MPVRAFHAPFMSVAKASLIESKQLLQLAQREVPLHVLLLIHHTAAQCLLVALALKDLLLNGSGLGCGDPGYMAKSSPKMGQENPGVETIATQEKEK